MGHAFLPLAFVVVGVSQPASDPPTTPVKQLSKADDEWVTKKYSEAATLGRAGKWGHDEAQAPVREILDLCTRELGKDHYVTAYYRREIEYLAKLAGLPEADRDEYRKTYVLWDERNALSVKQKYADALKPAEQLVPIYQRCLGPGSYFEAMAAVEHGHILHTLERFADAETQTRNALTIYLSLLGEYSPATIRARIQLSRVLDARGSQAEARKHIDTALESSRRLLGETNAMTAVARNNLAGLFLGQALYADAEDLYRKAIDALLAAGADSSPVLVARGNLAFLLDQQGKFAQAEKIYRDVLAVERKTRPDSPEIALYAGNLGVNLDNQGFYTQAESLHREALAIMSSKLGEKHSKTATAHGNLGVNLDNQGKYAEAQEHFEAALAISLAAGDGEAKLSAASTYNNLASCLQGQGNDDAALAAAEKAFAIFRDKLPADHPRLAAARNNLAASLSNLRRYEDADSHFRDALAVVRKKLGDDHLATAQGHSNLAVNLYNQGRFADAEPHSKTALDTLRRVVGEGHPSTAWAYKNVIGTSCARGDYARAELLADAAIASFEAARLRLSRAGVERAVRTSDVCPLPGLAVAAARRGHSEQAWQALERNLARGLLDDLAAQPVSPEDRELELALVGKLGLLDKRVALLRARGTVADDDRRKAEADRDAAQADMVRFQSEMAAKHGAASGLVYDLARIQANIPEGAALVAWVDLPAVPNWHDPKGDHWVCLVKRTGAPVWAPLRGTGKDDAWTDEDDDLSGRVRKRIVDRHQIDNWRDLAGKLAAQRLQPLKEALDGVRHLIVLPSGRLAGLPVEVLTDLTVSYAPSATMYAWLREKQLVAGAAKPVNHLLAFGDPANGKGLETPGPLPGARQELSGIGRVFDRSSEFKGAEASEQNLDRLANEEGGLRRFGYLHFATHGVLDDRRPMQSAILLARDALPDPLSRVLDGKEAYDGRVTAERMLRRWKLDAELVTLSACQTGLGKYTGGEGYLGFSQALFVAGARSLVLSLWEVDDTATALLMTRFYENLMGLPAGVPGGPLEPKRSKADALAEAKKWLRGLSAAEADLLRKDLPRQGTRGEIVKKAAAAKAAPTYEHPYYWSGFVLIGDSK